MSAVYVHLEETGNVITSEPFQQLLVKCFVPKLQLNVQQKVKRRTKKPFVDSTHLREASYTNNMYVKCTFYVNLKA